MIAFFYSRKETKKRKWEILRTEIKKCYILHSLHCSANSYIHVRDSILLFKIVHG